MKKIAVLTAMAVLIIFSFSFATVMAFPSLPNDLNIVQPDPSLPLELSAFLGKWSGRATIISKNFFLIIENIDDKEAFLRISEDGGVWETIKGEVSKFGKKYTISFRGKSGYPCEIVLQGKRLNWKISKIMGTELNIPMERYSN